MFFKKGKKIKKKDVEITNEAFKRLATSNIEHGLKEYIIYFITLTFGVALLYSFNSIDDILKILGGNMMFESILVMVRGIVLGFSILICIIFAFLMTYANNFLMKRRKREFGIYLTLGMNKREINKLMFKEATIIGGLALIVGLILGGFVSQGISMIAFKMIGISFAKFSFTFSIMATFKTVICFILVMFLINRFNKKNIKKYRLIDLIKSDKVNEVTLSDKGIRYSAVFIISIILMIASYFSLYLTSYNNKAIILIILIALFIVLIALGIYLFFLSVADFTIRRIQKHKKLYYNKLNIFIVNQVASRIRTLSLSMTMICLLLFSAMIIIPYGLSIGKALSNDLYVSTPFDATIVRYNKVPSLDKQVVSNKKDSSYQDFKSIFENSGSSINKIVKSMSELRAYSLPNVTFGKLIPKAATADNRDENVTIISLTDYNNVRKQQGLSPISLDKDNFAINYNSDEYKNEYENNKMKIDINNHELEFSRGKLYNTVLYTSVGVDSKGVIIVPDYVVEDLVPVISSLNIDYKELNNNYDNMLIDYFFNFENSHGGEYNINLKISIDGEKVSLNTVFSFMAIYLGIVFLITAGAVLALQQFSEINGSKEKYFLLRKLGVREKMLKKVATIQVSILFLMPLSLAAINSIFLYVVVHKMVLELRNFNLRKYIMITIIIIIVLYGIYFLMSLLESIKTIRDKK